MVGNGQRVTEEVMFRLTPTSGDVIHMFYILTTCARRKGKHNLRISFKVGEQTFGVAVSQSNLMNTQIYINIFFARNDAFTTIILCTLLSCKCAIFRNCIVETLSE